MNDTTYLLRPTDGSPMFGPEITTEQGLRVRKCFSCSTPDYLVRVTVLSIEDHYAGHIAAFRANRDEEARLAHREMLGGSR